MKQIFEVKLTYLALVLADDGEEAEEIARQERGEIVSDELSPEVECGVSFRSHAELDAWGDITGNGWGDECLPYGDDKNKLNIGQLLDEIEASDKEAASVAALRCKKTVDMFEAPEPVASPEPVGPPDFRLIVARRHAKAGEDWHMCGMRYIGFGEGAGALITGGIPNIDHKGEKRWTGVREEEVFVTEEQVLAASLAWESETGKCSVCGGSGQQNIRWHYKTGNEYGKCARCVGTGKAPEVVS